MTRPVYFISDIHLGLESADREKKKELLLVEFLRSIQDTKGILYIVGDLFDYWFEYKRVYQKGYFRTLTALADAVDRGIDIHYLIGNHDFLHRDFFQKEIGLHLHHDNIVHTLEGKKFYISHGDGLVANDIGYLILKKVLRSKVTQLLYSLIHPDVGIAIASGSSKSSRKYTAQKDYGEIDSMFESAKSRIDEGNDYVIFGHSHRRQLERWNNGYYINLGSWLDLPCYGFFHEQKFLIKDLNSNG